MSTTFHSVDQARRAARQRLPQLVFDFIDGAAGSERAMRRNREALEALCLLPRVLVNVEHRQLETTLFGRTWGLPFGIAPMGMCALAWPGADAALAAAAVHYNIPLGLSTAASSSIEETGQRAPQQAWFQLYVGQSEARALDLVARASDSGYRVLLLTVDVPEVAPRLRDLRNGFSAPLRVGPRQMVDFACHPRWSLQTLWRGIPRTVNFATDTGANSFKRGESRGKVDWDFLLRLRQQWPHTLVVKGVLAPLDAVRIRQLGIDAVYVSNHGGRQLDSAPPAIQMLPQIRQAVGADYPLLFDSGIRHGESIVKALAAGASFVMIGRPILYGLGAGGAAGLHRVIDILRAEISLTLAQLGCTDINALDPGVTIAPQPQAFIG